MTDKPWSWKTKLKDLLLLCVEDIVAQQLPDPDGTSPKLNLYYLPCKQDSFWGRIEAGESPPAPCWKLATPEPIPSKVSKMELFAWLEQKTDNLEILGADDPVFKKTIQFQQALEIFDEMTETISSSPSSDQFIFEAGRILGSYAELFELLCPYLEQEDQDFYGNLKKDLREHQLSADEMTETKDQESLIIQPSLAEKRSPKLLSSPLPC